MAPITILFIIFGGMVLLIFILERMRRNECRRFERIVSSGKWLRCTTCETCAHHQFVTAGCHSAHICSKVDGDRIPSRELATICRFYDKVRG